MTNQMEFNVDDILDMCDGLYWFLSDYHEGQFSDRYRMLCQISDIYKPSILARTCNEAGYYWYMAYGLEIDPQLALDFILKNV
jgi:hypothetical protein